MYHVGANMPWVVIGLRKLDALCICIASEVQVPCDIRVDHLFQGLAQLPQGEHFCVDAGAIRPNLQVRFPVIGQGCWQMAMLSQGCDNMAGPRP